MTRTPVVVVAGLLAAVGMAGAQGPVSKAPVPDILTSYPPVTADRLKRPEPQNWLMIRGTYDGWGYSPLDQITPANVARLQPVWLFATGMDQRPRGAAAREQRRHVRLDARQPGDRDRRAHRAAALALPQPAAARHDHPASDQPRRGALRRQGLLRARRKRVLVALDAKTGREVWSAVVEDNRKGYYMSLAPLVADGKVMVGASGGELGVRGFVAAYDVDTGKQLWRTFTVPAPGEPGSETWPAGGDQWKTGGGSVWVTGNYDPETNLAYLGHRQRRSVDGRSAARRQPLHRVDDRHRRRHRRDQGSSSSTRRTSRGTGTRCRRRSWSTTSAERPHRQRADRRRAQRLPLVSRAVRTARSSSSRRSRT